MFVTKSVLILLTIISVTIAQECISSDLLMCDGDTIQISSTVLCCNDSSICVQYDGTSIGSEAVYNTSDDYCITTNVMRTCTANRTWDEQTPSASEGTLDQASDEEMFESQFTQVWLGVGFCFGGIVCAVTVLIVTGVRRKKCGKLTVKKWYLCMIIWGVIVVIIDVIFWLAVLGYSVSNDFSEDDGSLRMDDSSCSSPTGKVDVRNALVITSFVFANLVQSIWISCASTSGYGIVTGCGGRCNNKCGSRCGSKCDGKQCGNQSSQKGEFLDDQGQHSL